MFKLNSKIFRHIYVHALRFTLTQHDKLIKKNHIQNALKSSNKTQKFLIDLNIFTFYNVQCTSKEVDVIVNVLTISFTLN